MAHSTLAVLSYPSFPQAFIHAINSMVTRQLGLCSYESGESRYGACDSIPCNQIAVVHDVATELDYCAACYREVSRG